MHGTIDCVSMVSLLGCSFGRPTNERATGALEDAPEDAPDGCSAGAGAAVTEGTLPRGSVTGVLVDPAEVPEGCLDG
jgi:hypothetical protein